MRVKFKYLNKHYYNVVNMNENEIINEILNILKNEKEGLTITEITERMSTKEKITRPTVSRYLLALELSGKITKRVIGRAKLFKLAKKGE
jgi:DNA-binding transcriptional ArsR family regulator